MNKEQAAMIEKEAYDNYSMLFDKSNVTWTSNELVQKCIESYITGRTVGIEREREKDERIKELEEVLDNNNAIMKSIVDDLPEGGLGLIFVKQQIASNDKYLNK